jgi:dolichol-phosphate mannosyltransferase
VTTLDDGSSQSRQSAGSRVPVQRRIPPIARHRLPTTPALTVLIPTRNEADNVAPLLDELSLALQGTSAEVLFVDDSDDDTPAVVQREGARWPGPVRVLHRPPGRRQGGLGGAVVNGLREAAAPWAVVMDGDLQHPPSLAPLLVAEGVASRADVVIASRYRRGGSMEGLGTTRRHAVSRWCTAGTHLLFPRRTRGVTDPMSGFFAVRRDALDLAALRPDGFKVLLEILLSTPRLRTNELPMRFRERAFGESKASASEALRFLRLVARRRFGRIAGFGAVGLSGVVVNTALLWLLVAGLHLHYLVAAAVASQGSTLWNFLLIDALVFRRWAEPYRRRRMGSFFVLNDLLLLLRIPVLAALVDVVGIGYLVANALTLLGLFAARFAVSDSIIYRTSGGTP